MSSTPASLSPTTRIIFMGTPDFAVPSLHALHACSNANSNEQNWQVVSAVTQPDRRAGRGKKTVSSPVKEAALALDIPILQPQNLRKNPDAVAELRALAPDLIVVAAYGLILPRAVLEIPTFGCVNVHASLLPAYRGASPITQAILDGLTETGNSIMLMDVGMDTGPVLAQDALPISSDDTTLTLTEKLARHGAELLVETLPRYLRGEAAAVPQDELAGEPSAVNMIEKEDGRINWAQSAAYIERMTRAFSPWPSAFTSWKGEPLKIVRATVDEDARLDIAPGSVVQSADGVAVVTGEGLLVLETVQPAGKRAMDTRSFLNGTPDFIGAQLGG